MSRRPVSGRLSGRVEHEVALPQFGPGVHLRLASDSSAEPAGGTRRPYLTPARLEELRQSLSARDLAVLRTLRTVRVTTGEQLGRVHCRSFAPAAADRGRLVCRSWPTAWPSLSSTSGSSSGSAPATSNYCPSPPSPTAGAASKRTRAGSS